MAKYLRLHEEVLARLEQLAVPETQIDSVRMHLRSQYVQAMQTAEEAQALRLEKRMWLKVFHAKILSYRHQKSRSRRKFVDKKRKRKIFQAWLQEASDFYLHLPLSEMRKHSRIGDLARYAGNHQVARKYYLKIRDGAAYNALGLLAEAEAKGVTSLFYFVRAMTTTNHPHSNLEGNIIRLKNVLSITDASEKTLFLNSFLSHLLSSSRDQHFFTFENEEILTNLLSKSAFSAQLLLECMFLTIHFLQVKDVEALAIVFAMSAKFRTQVLPALVLYSDWICATGTLPSATFSTHILAAIEATALLNIQPCRLPERIEFKDFGVFARLLRFQHLLPAAESRSHEILARKAALVTAARASFVSSPCLPPSA